ncbi:MAG TPA: FAD-dependent oxidoreductase [Pyrinomonadaceae bacterium]|nr:FAD-dependent oxidoreductase [Pyrinomonadaceae bacterium]
MDYEVIVVGGGIGGLTTAALLAAKGVKVCLFERQSQVGGCVANFEHQGYRFDPTAGLYSGWETGGVWEQIFSALRTMPPVVRKLSPSYVVRLQNGVDFLVVGDGEGLADEFACKFHPHGSATSAFYQQLARVDPTDPRNTDAVANRLASTPREFRLFIDAQLQALAQRTIAECTTAAAANILLTPVRRGMWAIEGGGQALADRLAESLKQSGGVLRLDAPVLRLAYASDGRAIGIDLLSGERVVATRAIISNLAIWDTYGKLIGLSRTPKAIGAELRQARAWGAYLMFLAMDEAAGERLAADQMLLVTGDDFADPQPLTLNVSGDAPEGKRAVTVSTLCEAEDWFSFHEDETSHETQDQQMLERFWARLHAAMPELGDSVEIIETATPRTFYETTRRKFGMIGPASGLPAQGAQLGHTSLPNVFVVSDTASRGFGLEGVASSAHSLAAEFL